MGTPWNVRATRPENENNEREKSQGTLAFNVTSWQSWFFFSPDARNTSTENTLSSEVYVIYRNFDVHTRLSDRSCVKRKNGLRKNRTATVKTPTMPVVCSLSQGGIIPLLNVWVKAWTTFPFLFKANFMFLIYLLYKAIIIVLNFNKRMFFIYNNVAR